MRKESVEARSISSGVNDDPALRTATVYRTLWSIAVQDSAAEREEKMKEIEKADNAFREFSINRDFPSLTLRSAFVYGFLRAAQAKDSTATSPQQPQAVICEEMKVVLERINNGSIPDWPYVLSGWIRKLTAC